MQLACLFEPSPIKFYHPNIYYVFRVYLFVSVNTLPYATVYVLSKWLTLYCLVNV
jgi:hypothetical protein